MFHLGGPPIRKYDNRQKTSGTVPVHLYTCDCKDRGSLVGLLGNMSVCAAQNWPFFIQKWFTYWEYIKGANHSFLALIITFFCTVRPSMLRFELCYVEQFCLLDQRNLIFKSPRMMQNYKNYHSLANKLFVFKLSIYVTIMAKPNIADWYSRWLHSTSINHKTTDA